MQKKRILILTLAGIMVMGSAFPTFAAKKKKISSVSLEVNTESLMESEMGMKKSKWKQGRISMMLIPMRL